MKLRVSEHVVCAWNWLLAYDPTHDVDESGFTLILRKSHPVWEFFRHWVEHLPEPIVEIIEETPWWQHWEERWSAEVAHMAVNADVAKTLYLPLVQTVEAIEGDDDE